MSQETQIGNLGGGGISEEDSRLVDSILNDINSGGQQPQQQPQQPQQQQPQPQQPQQQQPQQNQQPSPEQIRMMQQQQQQQQQQMAQRQQQMAQQQQMSQQQMEQKQNMVQTSGSNDILENIKIEAKSVMAVMFLCIFFNVDQVDSLFKTQSMFLNEGGSLNMQAVFIKALLIGIIFYIVKTYLL